MKNLAIIPARGGSKRIPRKNIKKFYGKPIISYSIEAAIKSNIFDEIMVSTEDGEIAEIAKSYGAKIPFLRSKDNSNDYATLVDVCLEVIEEYEKNDVFFDYACCILPTAPLINYENIIKAYKLLSEKNFDSVITVTEYSFPIQRSFKLKNNKLEMNWPENMMKRSQDLEKTYHDAGQFIFFKIEELKKQKVLYMKNMGGIILSNIEVQDIDNEIDWKLAELKYELLKKYLDGDENKSDNK
ncbi:pseudaminic acid cytidylyltransferase [Marinitoga aeolica]|uniref:Pseudaminic acid cytidylyltransferase n=1 Tax=Marinitoga aeolica TaxID=2809031 RepID=A0ABY8PMN7_9BACT|nr:pseudaminic acid cytidylyltransferase [Marinitoga aeolica]WGS63899.1 pseudaminic acid cytidylyltransferase [Marinitoga aeolica]